MAGQKAPRWSRRAASVVAITPGKTSAGARSLLFGLAALLLMALSALAFTGHAGNLGGGLATVRLLAALAAFFVAAPALLVRGIAAALHGLFGAGGGGGVAAAGLILNIGLLGAAVTVAALAYLSLHAAA